MLHHQSLLKGIHKDLKKDDTYIKRLVVQIFEDFISYIYLSHKLIELYHPQQNIFQYLSIPQKDEVY